ncbi:hypothetical protein [Paludibaculum fermentans]|uniref:hypothetical protein n=1 Tax=Paludibaculum fermentans TaxID=1473598 RepID=UPI003EBFDC83
MDTDSESRNLAVTLDQVLKKYGKIWIWSILMTFGATEFMRTMSGMNLLTFNTRSGQFHGQAGDAVIRFISGGIESVACFLSIFWLFQFMVSEILPMFFEVAGEAEISDGARLLYWAFGATLIGIGAELGGMILLGLMQLR